MVSLTIQLQHGAVMVIEDSDSKRHLAVTVKDKDGKPLAFGYADRGAIQSYAKAL